ncbi:MAG: U32 family peptidase [Oligoflexia bacterium]|nr:U32 family peptidase [Oligoflexia bacterium]
MNTNVELLAPAGDLHTAIIAYNAGADSVYLGLKNFSARKSATNFSFKDLRRLKHYALHAPEREKGREKGREKKIYVTLNTLLKDSELQLLCDTLEELRLIAIDGLIIQDLGLLEIIKTKFPEFKIHASTQMALHNSMGLEWAQKNGISRVVLSRELCIDAIKNLKNLKCQYREMELEVFIHGALCYSFSGLCLCSGLLLNRSGNRGECAQICRNYFYSANNNNPKNENKKNYCFSCNDLNLGRDILKLAEAGVNSFKIEGRMKSKEYVYNVVRFYRAILDEREKLSEEKYQQLSNAAKLTFSRKTSKGYFNNPKADDLIDNTYPGHRGIYLGSIQKVLANSGIRLKLNEDLWQNDQLLVLFKSGGGTHFNAFNIRVKAKKNQIVDIVEINLPSTVHMSIGDEVYLTQSKRYSSDEPSLLRSFDEKKIKVYKNKIKANLIFQDKTLTFFIPLLSKEYQFSLAEIAEIAEVAESEGNSFITTISKLLTESKDFPVEIVLDLDKVKISRNYIVPISLLKKIKNQLYQQVSDCLKEGSKKLSSEMNFKAAQVENQREFWHFLSRRKNLNPLNQESPFISWNKLKSGKLQLAEVGNWQEKFYFFPLHPIDTPTDVNANIQSMCEFFSKHSNNREDITFVVGLNNPAHFIYAKEIKLRFPAVKIFSDFYLYIANHFAFLNILSNLSDNSDLLFSYLWVENEDENENDEVEKFPFVKIKDKLELPLFISKGCYKKFNQNQNQNQNQNSCDGCKTSAGTYTYREDLINANKKFKVVVEECITYFYLRSLKF